MRVKSFTQFNESAQSIIFKDIHGNVAKEGDLIIDEDKKIGKVRRFFTNQGKHTSKEDRMEVDFRGHYSELNPSSKFEIIKNPDKKLLKAFD